jgi:hypothetical protein
MSKVLTILSSIVVIVIFLFGLTYLNNQVPGKILGSINDGGAYSSIVTYSANATNKDLVKLGQGIFGSVVITGAAAGTFEIYDATTTNGLIRTLTATSSLTKLASFPTNAAVGTYTFDTAFTQGLVVAFTSTQGTTTITYK